MNKPLLVLIPALLAAILASVLLSRVLAAPASNYTLDTWMVGAVGGVYQLSGSAAGSAAGKIAGGNYHLQGDLWQQTLYTGYLLLVVR